MTAKEILKYLRADKKAALMKRADEIRKEYCGNKVILRGLIEFSNYCVRNCLYCGLRRDNGSLRRYRMKPSEIIKASYGACEEGMKTLVLQSGDDFYYGVDVLCGIIKDIKMKFPDTAITLSVGERPDDEYKAFFDCGADRYLLRHETMNERLYKKLHPGQSLKERIRILEFLRKTGYQVGAGCVVGLPGQTVEDLCGDILFLQDFQPDMIGIGPFIPQSNTPLAESSIAPVDLALRVIALARVVTKNSHMPATTALATLDEDCGHILGLNAGCNVIMVNFTPSRLKKDYAIYDNKASVNLKMAETAALKSKREITFERGDSLKRKILNPKSETLNKSKCPK